MKRTIEDIDFNEIKLKIQTYENMYYTIDTLTKDAILSIKKELEKETTESVDIDDIINHWKTDKLCQIFGINMLDGKYIVEDKLIYLYEEQKLINTKEIKETLVEFKY